jgi:hypothetical protein
MSAGSAQAATVIFLRALHSLLALRAKKAQQASVTKVIIKSYFLFLYFKI